MMVDEERMKGVVDLALTVGHLVSGKDRKQFIQETKPYIQVQINYSLQYLVLGIYNKKNNISFSFLPAINRPINPNKDGRGRIFPRPVWRQITLKKLYCEKFEKNIYSSIRILPFTHIHF